MPPFLILTGLKTVAKFSTMSLSLQNLAMTSSMFSCFRSFFFRLCLFLCSFAVSVSVSVSFSIIIFKNFLYLTCFRLLCLQTRRCSSAAHMKIIIRILNWSTLVRRLGKLKWKIVKICDQAKNVHSHPSIPLHMLTVSPRPRLPLLAFPLTAYQELCKCQICLSASV